MYSILTESGHYVNSVYEYVIDTLSELQDLPENIGVGSIVYCIENSKKYMYNNSGNWVEVNFKKGGKGGDKEIILESVETNVNGEVRPSKGYDGLSLVVVNVPNSYELEDEGKVVDNGALVSQGSQSITQNGTYDTTLKNSVTVDVSDSSVTQLMSKGQVSDETDYMTAVFDEPFDAGNYDLLFIRLYRESDAVGDYAYPTSSYNQSQFSIQGGNRSYTMRFNGVKEDVKSISCTNYSGSYINIYVDVYGLVLNI